MQTAARPAAARQEHTHLPLAPNTSAKTTTVDSLATGGWYVRRYTIRVGLIRTGYARGGAEGPLGGIVGHGVSVDNPEGICVFTRESRSEAAARATYQRATTQVTRRVQPRRS